MQKIPFDDLDALKSRVGEDWGDFGEVVEVSQAMIDAFAELTGDRQWIHIDVERCKKESPFGGPIAHGFLTLSLLPHLGGGKRGWQVAGYGNAVNYGADKLRFLAPVPAGAKVHSRSRLVGADGTPKGTRLVNEAAIHVVGHERPAVLYRSIVLYQPKRGRS